VTVWLYGVKGSVGVAEGDDSVMAPNSFGELAAAASFENASAARMRAAGKASAEETKRRPSRRE